MRPAGIEIENEIGRSLERENFPWRVGDVWLRKARFALCTFNTSFAVARYFSFCTERLLVRSCTTHDVTTNDPKTRQQRRESRWSINREQCAVMELQLMARSLACVS